MRKTNIDLVKKIILWNVGLFIFLILIIVTFIQIHLWIDFFQDLSSLPESKQDSFMLIFIWTMFVSFFIYTQIPLHYESRLVSFLTSNPLR